MKLFRVLLFFILMLNVQAKDLYLTVYRDFSPNENSEILINYRNSEIMNLRILKPKDTKKFITGQVDLRRSWKKPQLEVNTSKYVMEIVNHTKLGIDWLRTAVDDVLRKELQADLGGGKEDGVVIPLVSGPEKIISIPEGFEVISEISVSPNTADSQAAFDVPGVDWWSHQGYKFETKKVSLPKLEAGFYIVQVLQGSLEGQVVLVVNDLLGYYQQSDNLGVVRVVDRSGRPVKGARVEARNLTGKWLVEEKTDKNGIVTFEPEGENELIILLSDEDRGGAIIDSEFYSTQAVYPDLFLYTDRPMYKSHDKVFFKGVLRKRDAGISELFFGLDKKVDVRIINNLDSKVVAEQTVEIGEYGTFTGELDLKKDVKDLAANGLYHVEAQLKDEKFIGEFRVKDYVKPLFFLEIESDQEVLKAGQKLKAQVKVERYAGGVPTGTTYKLELFRVKMQQPQWLDDEGAGEDGASETYSWDSQTQVDVSIPIPIISQEWSDFSSDGSANILLDIPTELPGAPNFDYQFLLKISARDRDGNFASKSKAFLDLKSENMLMARASAVYSSQDSEEYLLINSVYPSGKSYGISKGKIKWYVQGYEEEKALVEEVNFETESNGKFQVKIPTSRIGRVDAEITLFDEKKNESYSVVSVYITGNNSEPIEKVNSMQILSRRSWFNPGETSKSLVLLPNGWGIKGDNRGKIYLTVVGEKIFEHRELEVSGVTAWINQKVLEEYGRRFYITAAYPHPIKGWLEKSISFDIPPKDKLLKVKVKAKFKNVRPGDEQEISVKVTDSNNRPVRAEVSLSVVDKAVIDLQPEMRPSLLDFFYPLESKNIMSFFSSQFQGYGYGEYISSLFNSNHFVALTKTSLKKLLEKDTAHWEGQLETNEKGEGVIKFRLPGNQTLWKVSSIAVDKKGKFGEGGSEFTSNMPVTYTLAFPAAIRSGDNLKVRLNVANEKIEKEIPVSVNFADGNGIKINGKRDFEFNLQYKQEYSDVIDLSTDEKNHSLGSFSGVFTYDGKKPLEYEHNILIKPNFKEVKMSLDFEGSSLKISTANSDLTGHGELNIVSGLSGTISPALDWLITYPHGCVEQLTNTTVPNLAIASVFDNFDLIILELGKAASQEPKTFFDSLKSNFLKFKVIQSDLVSDSQIQLPQEFVKQLAQSRDFARAGVRELSRYQNSNGSMAWWAGSGKNDYQMSLYVAFGLFSSEVKEAIEGINYTGLMRWLSYEKIESKSINGVLVNYLKSILEKMKLSYLNLSSFRTELKFQIGEYVVKDGSLLEQALSLSTLNNLMLGRETEMQELHQQLEKLVYERLKDILSEDSSNFGRFLPPVAAQFRYLGKIGSIVAIAGHSLQFSQKMDGNLKGEIRKFLIKQFDGRSFGSTYENATVLNFSRWLIKDEILLRKTLSQPIIEIDGKKMQANTLESIASFHGWKIKIPKDILSQVRDKISYELNGEVLDAKLSYSSKELFNNIKPLSNGYNITRKYFKIDEVTGVKKALNFPGDKLIVGELVYLEIDVEKTKPTAQVDFSNYSVVEIDIPSGLTFLQEDRRYKASPFNLDFGADKYEHRKVEADKVILYVDEGNISKFKAKYGLVMRVNYSGIFTTGIARAFDFYHEEYSGNTASQNLSTLPVGTKL